MNSDEISRLRELASAATPGPWIKAGPWPHVAIWKPNGEFDYETNSDTEEPDHVCDVHRSSMNEHGEWQLSSPEQDANAAFIAAARTALPSLLDENDRLRAALREACNYTMSALLACPREGHFLDVERETERLLKLAGES